MIVAQLSDVHAASDNDNLARLDRALAWLERLRPDALVVSGDLIDEGHAALYPDIVAQLSTMACPILAIPGNADDLPAFRIAFAGQGPPPEGPLNATLVVDNVRLIGIETTLPGTASGDVSAHLGWLEEVLASPGPVACLLALHHHVFETGIAPIDQAMCAGVDALAAVFDQYKGRPFALASGHAHRPASAALAGVPVHICGSICPVNPLWLDDIHTTEANEGPMVMVHRLAGGSWVGHHVVV